MPTIRYREEERKALIATPISNKIIPLVEIVTEKPRSNSNASSIDTFVKEFSNLNTEILLDFPLYIKLSNQTKPTVSNFLGKLIANIQSRTSLYLTPSLLQMNNLIPVCTYNPNSAYIPGSISSDAKILRKHYSKLAFRIFPSDLNLAFTDLLTCIKQNDIIIFDIDEMAHQNSNLSNSYSLIQSIKAQINVHLILLRSAIPSTLTNVSLTNNQIINVADNGLLKDYVNLGFDAFGDFMGVKKDSLTEGGTVSPGFIFYSWINNAYYGYKGVVKQASSFENIIVPAILNSTVWKQYSSIHRRQCFGCSSIQRISIGTKAGNSQKEWKGFAASHYLYTMEEFL